MGARRRRVVMGTNGPERIFGSFQDIDELKRTELAHEESQKRIASIVDEQQEVICRFLPDGTLTFVNKTFAQLFVDAGQESSLIGKRWSDIADERDAKLIRRTITQLNDGQEQLVWATRTYPRHSLYS